jgi:hypothetical protein
MLEPLNMIVITLSCFVFIGIVLYLVRHHDLWMLGIIALPIYTILTINFIVLWVTDTIAIVPYIVTVCIILCWDFAIGVYVIKFKNMKLIISYVILFALILIGGLL